MQLTTLYYYWHKLESKQGKEERGMEVECSLNLSRVTALEQQGHTWTPGSCRMVKSSDATHSSTVIDWLFLTVRLHQYMQNRAWRR